MKPSNKRTQLVKEGKIILRPMSRRHGMNTVYVVGYYSGYGWANWNGTGHYKTQDEAIALIKKLCTEEPDRYFDDQQLSNV